jgi:hypothetical protein
MELLAIGFVAIMSYLSLDYIVPAAAGMGITWLIQKLKGTPWVGVLTNPKILVLVIGVIGSGIALALNPLLVFLGLAKTASMAVLVERAFAITATTATLTYTNLVKKKKAE